MKRYLIFIIGFVVFLGFFVASYFIVDGKITDYIADIGNNPSTSPDNSAGDGSGDSSGDDNGNAPEEAETVEIFLQTDEHCFVTSENPAIVKKGETALFSVVFSPNYDYNTVTVGYYNEGLVKVSNCSSSFSTSISSRMKNQYFMFDFEPLEDGMGEVTCDVSSGRVKAGTDITITADLAEQDIAFLGWSVGNSVLEGGDIVSYSPTYTFVLTENVKLFPNFLAEGYKLVKYHLNGGVLASDRITNVIYSQFDTSIKPCPNLMADDGTIVREGYNLLEFTTESDGGGIAVNPGGIISIPENGILEVWAQWAEWNPVDDFRYSISGNSVTISAFIGESSTVSVPAYINGKPVTKITSGAFVGGGFDTLVLPNTIKTIESGAFKNCAHINTLYICDNFTSIPDDAFLDCKKFSNLRLNAVRKPCYATSSESMTTRWEYIMTRNPDIPLIILVGGSSSLYGYNTPYLEELLEGDFQVINCGTNAGGLGILYIEALSKFLYEGDIVVHAPEFYNYQMGKTELTWRTFRATECCYNMYRYVDFSKYTSFFSQFTYFNTASEARGNSTGGSYNVRNRSLTAPHCDLAGTRTTMGRTFSAVKITASGFNDQLIKNFNSVIDPVISSGIRFYYSSPPMYKNNFFNVNSEAEVNKYLDKVKQNLHCDVISSPLDYLFDVSVFYDSVYHLDSIGAKDRTERLYRDLIAQFEKEAS